MATARKVELPVPPVKVPFEIVLTMSEEEAQAVADILAKVGGDSHTRRMYIANVLYAITEAGINFGCGLKDVVVKNGSGLFFTEGKV